MHIIVVGAGVTGIACAHNFLKRGHNVTLIEKASTPNQECSFGMAGFMGPISVQMLCAPFKGKAGLASIFAKTRRLGWDVSISQMKFLRALANARSADVWAANHESLMTLARYSVGLTEFHARLEDLSFEQVYGLLRVVDGHRFMPDVEPEKKELASRDVVSRRMEERIAQGKGVKSRFGEHLWLDITLLGENHIKHNLREVYEICHYFLGVDPTKDWIPVRPAQHYTMGGVRTNPNGESQTLKGLFAAGEAACWDMHGFNRLGGNSVAETVVAGMIIGETIADFCDKPENAIDIPTRVVYDFIKREQSKLDAFVKNNGKENMAEIRTRMQEIMTTKVGIFREGEKLKEAVEELEDLYKKSFNVAVKNQPGANPELVYAYRTQKMLRVALGMALGASLRTESRGAHFRVDYPVRNDAEWCKRTLSTWKNESDTLPTITYQDLDISKMELPPGWRGYGAKNYIDNPETPVRQKQVDEIRAKLESEGADRFAVQNALMPYLQLLPEDLRGKNERIDEPLS